MEEVVPKTENTLFGESFPHLGHLISLSLSAILRRSSNFSPHFEHSYSYMGMVENNLILKLLIRLQCNYRTKLYLLQISKRGFLYLAYTIILVAGVRFKAGEGRGFVQVVNNTGWGVSHLSQPQIFYLS